MKKLVFMVAALLVLGIFTTAQATIINTVGDKDCFGFDGSCSNGSLWRNGQGEDLGFFGNYREPSDPLFTDIWSYGVGVTYNHTYSLDGTATSAVLQVLIAGIADNEDLITRGPWTVFFNGEDIGVFNFNTSANSYQEIREFNFTVPVALLTGSDTILLDINTPVVNDGFSIDYSELTINTVPVPEPSTMLLLGLGLAGLAALRRKSN